jgi:hypothetical protein
MSSLSGSAVGGDKVPTEGEKEDKAPEMSPPASQKRGHPKGSRNKKTLEALAGAKLTWEYVVDVGAYSSLIPGNGARKLA